MRIILDSFNVMRTEICERQQGKRHLLLRVSSEFSSVCVIEKLTGQSLMSPILPALRNNWPNVGF